MPDINIRGVEGQDWDQLKPLWLALYHHAQTRGLLVEVPPGAYESWANSFAGLLGRMAFALVAEADGGIVGFVAGRIRVQPKHFGGHQVGYFSDVFISESHRRRGIAHRLITAGQTWFRERGIDRLEVAVVAGDDEARAFYQGLGWKEDFVQMVYEAEPIF